MTTASFITLGVIAVAFIIGLIYGLHRVLKIRGWTLVIGGIGALIGLLFSALLAVPLTRLPEPYNAFIPLFVTIVFVLGSVAIFIAKMDTIVSAILLLLPKRVQPNAHEAVVDTSVLIDGRIEDVAKTGFVPAHLVVPRFVLSELQQIADSSDSLKRNRGRRGLEVLNKLSNHPTTNVEITDDLVPEAREVDAKLVKLAKNRGASILTNDFNLNRVAKIEGIQVLNINDLANAIKTVLIPGEKLSVKVVQKGKEKTQGVGYLPDGTMIVVEGGAESIGNELDVEVTRIFQTSAGKMVFTALKQETRK